MKQTYNGWKNYETWNVALWIGNDEGLHATAIESGTYKHFANYMKEYSNEFNRPCETPDGVRWDDPCLDTDSLNQLIKEIGGDE